MIYSQDSYGDTVLHDAIAKDFAEIVELLINFRGVDLSVKNKRGFNCLHHAALKGNTRSVQIHDTVTNYTVHLCTFRGWGSLSFPFSRRVSQGSSCPAFPRRPYAFHELLVNTNYFVSTISGKLNLGGNYRGMYPLPLKGTFSRPHCLEV